jgi:hypothetical protein
MLTERSQVLAARDLVLEDPSGTQQLTSTFVFMTSV